jgi:hypothetical protein
MDSVVTGLANNQGSEIVDDLFDFGERHGVSRFWCGSLSHRTVVGVDASVSSQVEIRIVELPIKVIYRYSSFASILKHTKDGFG